MNFSWSQTCSFLSADGWHYLVQHREFSASKLAWSFLESTTPAWASLCINCKFFTSLSSSCLSNSNRILLGSGDALGAASCCSFANVNFPMGVWCWDSLGVATASSLKHKRDVWCLADEAGWCFDCKISLVVRGGSPGDVWDTGPACSWLPAGLCNLPIYLRKVIFVSCVWLLVLAVRFNPEVKPLDGAWPEWRCLSGATEPGWGARNMNSVTLWGPFFSCASPKCVWCTSEEARTRQGRPPLISLPMTWQQEEWEGGQCPAEISTYAAFWEEAPPGTLGSPYL